ncbi:non-homologous end joining protein Ku [Xylophilus sp.]|uniref:non-homologous end joining protein Ku n=1 Tax=Xylophilus sp. TaxID=2653893 RepID=UPI0013B63DD3|nr:Ku protein [Xylophilus sp.]KAF1045526.1 MAG: Non-homologous end joining protein Ku [Xylophilus sp.]
MNSRTPAPPAAAPASSRALWKGAISFGLVHIPVALYSATTSSGVDFDWLDKRTMDPVGYKRINKKTGKEVAPADIVKGVEYEDGKYVVLTPEEIASAYPRTTQTIEIEAFIDAAEIPFVYLERPYYIAPVNRGEKVYALLREALLAKKRVGVARVVIQTKQHLAVLVPAGPALVLNLLRWGGEIRSWEQLKLPPEGSKANNIRPAEMEMAAALIDDMTAKWEADHFRDSFKEEILRLVETKARAGEIEQVEEEQAFTAPRGAEVIDLTSLLRRSLEHGRGERDAPAPAKKQAAPRRKAAAKAPARRRAA